MQSEDVLRKGSRWEEIAEWVGPLEMSQDSVMGSKGLRVGGTAGWVGPGAGTSSPEQSSPVTPVCQAGVKILHVFRLKKRLESILEEQTTGQT